MSSEFTREVVMKFQPLIFLKFDVNVFKAILFISSKKFTAHYACRNADLNVAMTNGFTFHLYQYPVYVAVYNMYIYA